MPWPGRCQSCDLLSISDLWHTWHTRIGCIAVSCSVVICFQSLIFDILDTLHLHNEVARIQLWFAFNLWSLTYLTHLILRHGKDSMVVICFQSLIFDILDTLIAFEMTTTTKLWFAFNLWSLTYLTHSQMLQMMLMASCDLLSISDLWHTWHTKKMNSCKPLVLWFAFNLWSLTYLTHYSRNGCFNI